MTKWNLNEKGVVQDLRLSYSKVSGFLKDGPKSLITKKDLSGKEGPTIGSIVDILLFEPDKFDKEFYVFKAKVPTASAKDLADIITTNHTEVPSREKVYEIAKTAELWGSIKKEETYYKKFDYPEFWDYLASVFESKNKELVSQEDVDWAKELVEILRTHDVSKDIVAFPEENESKYAQMKLKFKYKQFWFTALIDLVTVYHDKKTFKFTDLKTGSPNAEQFSKNFLSYRYDIQALVYTLAAETFKKEYGLEDYTFLGFDFLYISRFQKLPVVYEVTDKWIQAAQQGFVTPSGYKYMGLDEAIDDIEWHWVNKEFDLPRNIVEQGGVITLNDDFITVDE